MVGVEHNIHFEESSLDHLSVDDFVFANHLNRILFTCGRELCHIDPTKGSTAKLCFENEVLKGDLLLRDR